MLFPIWLDPRYRWLFRRANAELSQLRADGLEVRHRLILRACLLAPIGVDAHADAGAFGPSAVSPAEDREFVSPFPGGPPLKIFDPVTAPWFIEVGTVNDILKNPAVLLNRSDRPNVVVIAGHEDPINAKVLVGDPK